MTVESYSELKTFLTNYIDRTELDTFRDTYIDFAEAYFNRYFLKNGPPYQMEEETSLSTDSSGNATLPTDVLGIRSVRRVGSPNIELKPISMGGENRLSPYDTAGIARWYSISGTTFRVTPIESGTNNITFTYYEKIPALADANTSNWLLALAPDAYVYRALAEAFTFARKFDIAAPFMQHVDVILGEVCGVSDQTRYHNAEIIYDGIAP